MSCARGVLSAQTIVPEALATRGHRSAHSFATGPVMADPFISPLGLIITPALSGGKKPNGECGEINMYDFF